jgi:hypothetical protein
MSPSSAVARLVGYYAPVLAIPALAKDRRIVRVDVAGGSLPRGTTLPPEPQHTWRQQRDSNDNRPIEEPSLHPNLAEIYREKVAALHMALSDPRIKDEAFGIIRTSSLH